MKNKSSILMMSVLMLMASCQNVLDESMLALDDAPTFEAQVECFDTQTKTSMTRDNNIVWTKGDQITVFRGSSAGEKYVLSDASDGLQNGSFYVDPENGNGFYAGTEVAANVAFYPYMQNITASNVTLPQRGTGVKISGINLPATQQWQANSFGNGAFAMVAVTRNTSDHTLQFRNLMGALRLRLKGYCTVKKITISGKNGERISGPASVTAGVDIYDPEIIMADYASGNLELTCGDGVQLNDVQATDFMIALPPVRFEKGFIVKIIDSENKVHQLEANALNVIQRSYILNMPEVMITNDGAWEGASSEYIEFADSSVEERCVEMYDFDGNGKLSYMEAASVTTLNGLFWTYETLKYPWYDPATGEMGVSEGYRNARMVYHECFHVRSFDELQYFTGLQEIDPYAFAEMWNLESVTLPSGVRKIGVNAFARCDKLTQMDFPEGVRKIYSFPPYLRNIILPEGVTEVQNLSFNRDYSASAPTEYTLSLPKTLKSIRSINYSYYPDNYTVNFTGSGMASDGVTLVNEDGELLYYFDDGRSEYSVPEGVKTIKGMNSQYVTSITFPSTLEEPSSNIIPNRVTTVKGKFATADGKSLVSGSKLIGVVWSTEEYEIPASISSLAHGAFRGTGITSIEIPSTVHEMGQGVFSGCSELTEVVLPANMKNIPNSTFSSCVKLKNINLSNVTSLEAGAFSGCTELLKRFKVPAGIMEIGYGALNVSTPSILEFQSSVPPTLSGGGYFLENNVLTEAKDTFGPKTTVYVPDAAMARYKSQMNWANIDTKPVSVLYAAPEVVIRGPFNNRTEYDEDGNLVESLLFEVSVRQLDVHDCFRMIEVPGGSYERTIPYTNPLQTVDVTITKDFYIADFEVSQAVWEAVMYYNPCYVKRPDGPVYGITPEECDAFIAELNRLTGMNFRLPTEAEWEWAARGSLFSQGYLYPGTNDAGSVAWSWNYNGPDGPSDIRTGPVNELNLYCMYGNVWELCSDSYYQWNNDNIPRGSDPFVGTDNPYIDQNWIQGVARGGNNARYSKVDGYIGDSTNRFNIPLNISYSSLTQYLGLRLAMDDPADNR